MFALSALPVPVAVAVAMFQRRLYDVQLVASRTLTYVALSAVLAGVYAMVVVGVGVMLQDRGAPWLPLAATAVVAVAFAPLRDWVQGVVNHLTYGRWAAPATVLGRHRPPAGGLRRLGRPARRADHRDGRGPGLLLRRDPRHPRSGPGRHRARGSADRPPATDGVRTRRRRAALVRQVAQRRSTGTLLEALSHQIGGAVHTAGLVEQLRDAQGRLVMAREQERRRLRSDLHDGLGPALAGMGFQLDAVQNLIADGRPVEDRLHRLRTGLSETVVEVRRIVEGLRPPTIDDLGLFGAIAELGRELADGAGTDRHPRPARPATRTARGRRGGGVPRDPGGPDQRRPARARHAVSDHRGADRPRARHRGGRRRLWRRPRRHGLGIPGMRDRAAEIGGSVEVSTGVPGTTVRLRLPLRAEVAA